MRASRRVNHETGLVDAHSHAVHEDEVIRILGLEPIVARFIIFLCLQNKRSPHIDIFAQDLLTPLVSVLMVAFARFPNGLWLNTCECLKQIWDCDTVQSSRIVWTRKGWPSCLRKSNGKNISPASLDQYSSKYALRVYLLQIWYNEPCANVRPLNGLCQCFTSQPIRTSHMDSGLFAIIPSDDIVSKPYCPPLWSSWLSMFLGIPSVLDQDGLENSSKIYSPWKACG